MAKKSSEREVLYLKYRPQLFSEVFGQDYIKKTLLSALLSNHISHAYLFAGSRGTGKTTIARILAKAVNCANPKNGEPCNKCESCKEITAGKSLDVIEIDAASNRGIDEIRELRDKIKFSPAKSRYKVFIIDEVHMLTREAFNALLKTLEEPPPHALFILATTEIHKVPETILSRCQRFDFSRIKMADLISYLKKVSQQEKLKVENGGIELIAANAGGALRDAVNLLDQAASLGSEITVASLQAILGLTDISAVYRLVDLLINQKITDAIELINELLERGYNLASFDKKLIEHLRHILILKVSGRADLIEVTAEQLERIKNQATDLSSSQLLTMIKIFLQAEKKSSLSSLPQLPLEIAVLEINETEPEIENKGKNINIENDNNEKKRIDTNPIKKNEIKKNRDTFTEASKQDLDQFNKITKDWNAILNETKLSNYSINAFLKACKPCSLEDDTLFLDFFYSFHKEKISEPKNRDVVEKAIKKVIGKSYKIKCQFKPENIEEKKEEDEDELLKTALEVFGGEIIE